MAKRSIRQGQLVSPFGVGAIIDIGQESFVMVDISRWKGEKTRLIQDSHLERKLKRAIKAPIAKDDVEPVAIHRFPRWHFCPRCRLMRMVTGHDDQANDYQVPHCMNPKCKGELTPMGFVAACRNGHLSDVDWHWWAHSANGAEHGACSRQGAQMWFETTGEGGGDWSAISVRCRCGAKRNFVGLVQVEGPGGMACNGGQPWQLHSTGCGEKLTVYRRAASNLHFPKQISALDLLPIDADDVTTDTLVDAWSQNPFWKSAESLRAAEIGIPVILEAAKTHAERIASQFGCALQKVMNALERALDPDKSNTSGQETDFDVAQKSILAEEWITLSSGVDITNPFLDIKRKAIPKEWPDELKRTIRSMSMVRRLREVRALLGFRRLNPDEDTPLVPVDLGTHPLGWYPGVEAWGEGIFIQMNAKVVVEWERRVSPGLVKRMAALQTGVANMGWDASMASPRFVMLHSLAHAIVRRLGYDAGYSASSIRERVYSGAIGTDMCGILLYTADGDSEGSLGGLVRMGEPSRFGTLLQSALLDIAWCSADPVCKETTHQGAGGMNAAACHACVLVSETSCSCNNSLLDRRMLVGIGAIEPFFQIDKLSEYE